MLLEKQYGISLTLLTTGISRTLRWFFLTLLSPWTVLCLLVYCCLDSMKQRLEPIFKAAFVISKRSRKCWGDKRMWTWFYVQKCFLLRFFGKRRSKKVYCKNSITSCLCKWAWQNKIHTFSYVKIYIGNILKKDWVVSKTIPNSNIFSHI